MTIFGHVKKRIFLVVICCSTVVVGTNPYELWHRNNFLHEYLKCNQRAKNTEHSVDTHLVSITNKALCWGLPDFYNLPVDAAVVVGTTAKHLLPEGTPPEEETGTLEVTCV